MITYKMRVECFADLQRFIEVNYRILHDINITPVELDGTPVPDVDCSFSAKESLESLRDVLRMVPDGHVMVQTIQPIEAYTGERDWDIAA